MLNVVHYPRTFWEPESCDVEFTCDSCEMEFTEGEYLFLDEYKHFCIDCASKIFGFEKEPESIDEFDLEQEDYDEYYYQKADKFGIEYISYLEAFEKEEEFERNLYLSYCDRLYDERRDEQLFA